MPENCETKDLVLHRYMLLPKYVVFWRYIKIQNILLKKSEIILYIFNLPHTYIWNLSSMILYMGP